MDSDTLNHLPSQEQKTVGHRKPVQFPPAVTLVVWRFTLPMYYSHTLRRGPLTILADYRFKTDNQLDDAEPHRASHVLDMWRTGKAALGPRLFGQTQRVALFEYGAEPSARERTSARDQLRNDLDARVTVLLPTPDQDEEGESQTALTIAWSAFAAPDSLSEMRGTFYEWAPGKYVIAVFPHSPYLKQLQYWQQEQWLRRAYDIAHGRARVLTCPRKYTIVDDEMLAALHSMQARPLAVDIESIEGTSTVTAIGVSDGHYAVSLPWHGYQPYGHDAYEPGIDAYADGASMHAALHDLLHAGTPKVFHNHTFDLPRLQALGLEVNGPIHDTFAAHGIAYPELRHGLQHACASLLNIPPWKSAWHPKLRGITRDDIEYWICDPLGLRDYNADDAYYTYHLAHAVMPCVHVDLFT